MKKLTARRPNVYTVKRQQMLIERIMMSDCLDIMALLITSKSKRTRELKELIMRLFHGRINRAVINNSKRIRSNAVIAAVAEDRLRYEGIRRPAQEQDDGGLFDDPIPQHTADQAPNQTPNIEMGKLDD